MAINKWRDLYFYLGDEIVIRYSTANDMSTSERLTLHYSSQIEVMQDIRNHMRAVDPGLPESIVDSM